ncbi:FAD-binding oxidoreductase [Actinomadura livida]|uniref:FAD-binding oxidoreductase n=1 Tax=Actinomadura livida TaxID=79909 RepID=A0A7W7IGJ2_9ACTN|nr:MULTISPECIES: FAD-binding oxidoreductase [Actinomadura]MBB4776698.1 glycolate oxidase FAD binding subunit [Actinomadura catellatispora]GGT94197.1 FAD-linked oxidase [Actinomadura livida]
MRPLDALAKVCGDVRPGEPADGVLGVEPSVVAAPKNVAEAADVMRVAAEQGLAVVPRGAETRLDWGTPPERCDLLVDTHRLDALIEHAEGDLVAKTEAGLPLERLAERLAERGQRLALDNPLPGSTVGGTIATGAAGALRTLYGTPRNLVIGLTIVRADGQVARSGGKVVKNVAGYDLGRLFSGSYGTLGLIVEATFRLHPLAPANAYVTCAVSGPEEAHDAVQSVLHSPVAPSAVEYINPGTVAVLLEGVPDGVDTRAHQTKELLGERTEISETAPEGWGQYPDGTTLIGISAPPPALRDLLSLLGPEAAATWSGSGHGHVGLPAGMPADEVAATLDRLRECLSRYRGNAVVRYAPQEVRDEIDVWGPVPALALMRRVKDQFDPDHRLSPGRFVGGM